MNFSHWPAFARATLGAYFLMTGLTGCDDGDGGTAVTGEFPVAYVERPFPRDANGDLRADDLHDPAAFRPGARLMLKRRAAPDAAAEDITSSLFAPGARYDVRDISASWDGSKLLFSLRGPFIPGAREEDQPRWAIWEYEIATRRAHRVISSDLVADEGHDIMPAWLPDGRIVFASTRQRGGKAVLVDEGKPQFSPLSRTLQNEVFSLHVMDAAGDGIRQITFSDAHDLWPVVLQDGRILFTRIVLSAARETMHFYTVLPDGRALAPSFGAHSHDTVDNTRVEFSRPHVLDDGRVLAIERPFETRFHGGSLSAIDVAQFSDRDQRVDTIAGSGGITPVDMPRWPSETSASRAGRYLDAVPLGDNTGRLLVSWTACRLREAGGRLIPCAGNDASALPEAPPIYGVFVFDPSDGTRLPVVVPREGMLYDSLAVAVPRRAPAYIRDGEAGAGLDAALLAEGSGILDIRSVHDIDGEFGSLGGPSTSLPALVESPAYLRPARFLRLEKAVAIPDRDVRDFRRSAFGVSSFNGMRQILGYVPVEPDGSVRVRVPAGVPIAFSITDALGRRLGARHDTWIQVMAGEVRVCGGCHAANSRLPHGRNDSGVLPVNTGAVAGIPFARTNPLAVPQAGETMAQLRSRLDAREPAPMPDVLFTDTWYDAATRAPDAPVSLPYADLATPAPATATCVAAWSPGCRTVIHYETHIHPLWSVDRRVYDTDGVTLVADHTCTGCHNVRDAAGNVMIPAAQIDLHDGYSGEAVDHMIAYRELFAADNRQVIDDGTLVDELVPQRDADGNIVYQLDENGDPVIDETTGLPVPVEVPVVLRPPMVDGSAGLSSRFFLLFSSGGTHNGWLTQAELRLLAEWTDLGAQYFNDPFAAPVND